MFTVFNHCAQIFFITAIGPVTSHLISVASVEHFHWTEGKCDRTLSSHDTHTGTQQTTLSPYSVWQTGCGRRITMNHWCSAHRSQTKLRHAHNRYMHTHTFLSYLLLIHPCPYTAWCFSLCYHCFYSDRDRWRDWEGNGSPTKEEKSPSAFYFGLK